MMSSEETQEIIYTGIRDETFKDLIKSLLIKGKLKEKYINFLTNETNIELYSKAFTSASADKLNNYEIFEQLGDLSANKFIVSYAYNRFPQLDCPLGVKVVARIRINYGSRKSFSKIGEDMGFWNYISASEEDRTRKKKDLLEDCVESFIGCTEYILDKKYRPGVGYGIVYDILSNIFDDINISLNYEDLYDSKTKLKELFDMHKNLGDWTYIDIRKELLSVSYIFQVPPGVSKQAIKNGGSSYPQPQWILLGEGIASKKTDSQQKAAEIALITLKKYGFYKVVSKEYLLFSN